MGHWAEEVFCAYGSTYVSTLALARTTSEGAGDSHGRARADILRLRFVARRGQASWVRPYECFRASLSYGSTYVSTLEPSCIVFECTEPPMRS